jgi:hypothetical protein
MIPLFIWGFKILKFSFLMLKFKKVYGVPFRSYSPVRVLDKFLHGERFFFPYGKNLSLCGKSCNQSINNYA